MNQNIYKIMRTRKMDPIPGMWNARSHTQYPTEKFHGVKISDAWHYVKNGEFTAFYIDNDWERVGQFLSNRIITEERYIPVVYQKQKSAGHALVDFSHEIRSLDLKQKTLDELLVIYKQIEETWVGFDYINVLPWFIGGDYVQAYLQSELGSRYKVADEDIEVLMTPIKPSFSAEEELGINRAALEILENGDAEKYIGELVEKYYWIPFGYDGPVVYDRNHYEKTIQEIIKTKSEQGVKDKIAQIEEYGQDIKAKQAKIYEKYSIPSSIQKNIDSIHALALMTDERKEYAFQANEAFYRVISEIASKLGVEFKILKYVLLDEVKQNLSDPKKLTEIARERIDHPFLVHWKNGECEVLSRDEAERLTSIAIPKVDQVTEIKGQIGCRGSKNITIGKVRLLLASSEINRFKKGEILVTTMTSPEFVPAMRKSLAIITDEGGITCHAAIISRELKIPCVIGTKIATKILKDGDLVEVDAEKGVVKIFRDEDLVTFLTRPISIQRDFFFFNYCFNHGLKFLLMKKNGEKYDWFLEKSSWFALLNDEAEKLQSKDEWESLLHQFPDITAGLYKSAERLAKKSDIFDCIDDYDHYNYFLDKLARYFVLPFAVENILYPRLQEYFKDLFGTTGDEALSAITAPPNLIDYQKMQLNILEALHSDTFDSKIDHLVKEYNWLSLYTFTDVPYSSQYFIEISEQLRDPDVARQVENYPRSIVTNNEQAGAVLDKIKDPQIRLVASIINRYVTLRTERVDAWRKTMPMLREFYLKVTQSIKHECGLSDWELIDTINLTRLELKEFLSSRRVPDLLRVRNLYLSECIYQDKDERRTLGKGSQGGDPTKPTSFSGAVAFRGKVISRVRIIAQIKDKDKMNPGDILVAHMTSPEYVPLMMMAAAIVTDEGGITCHAAIISRELKKPCIIGTKIATKVLKDGDLVEVDAERGVVTIIEKGNNSAVEETDKPAIGPEHVEGQEKGIVRIIK